jgi:hypothetical protein
MTAAINDRRAKILARLDYILNGLSITLTDASVVTGKFVHNRNELPKEKVPGIILLDADEVSDPSTLRAVQGRQLPMGAKLMRMTPEIYAVLDVRIPNNVNVGEDLNLMRAAILNAIYHDTADTQGPSLSDICGSNGTVIYDGCVTDLARNRTMKGQLGISVSFVYPLFPQELASQ